MNVLLLMAMFLAPGVQALTGATVTGVVRDTDGKPLVDVRVAAMPTTDADRAHTLTSIAETDQTGRYRLEVATGSYFIVAGRIDQPTYYPGVRGPEGATAISLVSGSATTNLDFVIFAITGVVRNPRGEPLSAVRVTAIGVPTAGRVGNGAGAPVITGNTDDTGHYRLEVPPGRYYVSAGQVGRSAYYPGTADARNAASITVGFGAGSRGLDFDISEESSKTRPEDTYLMGVELANFGLYANARLLLQTFIMTYPQNEFVPQAKYALADSLYREGSPDTMTVAGTLFEEYVRLFPSASQVAEARQRLSEIQRKRGPKDQ